MEHLQQQYSGQFEILVSLKYMAAKSKDVEMTL